MFNPLLMLRELSRDTQLTTAQFAILTAAIYHTDNRTGRVRASQEMLADTAKTTERTVRTFYRSKAFERYFEAEWSGRRLELTWLDTGSNTGSDTGSSFRPSTSTTTTSTRRPVLENYLDGEEYLLAVEDWDQRSIGSLIQSLITDR